MCMPIYVDFSYKFNKQALLPTYKIRITYYFKSGYSDFILCFYMLQS